MTIERDIARRLKWRAENVVVRGLDGGRRRRRRGGGVFGFLGTAILLFLAYAFLFHSKPVPPIGAIPAATRAH